MIRCCAGCARLPRSPRPHPRCLIWVWTTGLGAKGKLRHHPGQPGFAPRGSPAARSRRREFCRMAQATSGSYDDLARSIRSLRRRSRPRRSSSSTGCRSLSPCCEHVVDGGASIGRAQSAVGSSGYKRTETHSLFPHRRTGSGSSATTVHSVPTTSPVSSMNK